MLKINNIFSNINTNIINIPIKTENCSYVEGGKRNKFVPTFRGKLFSDEFKKSSEIAEKSSVATLEDGSKFELRAKKDGNNLGIKRRYFNQEDKIAWSEKMRINLETGELKSILTHRSMDDDDFSFYVTVDKKGNITLSKDCFTEPVFKAGKSSLVLPNGDRFDVITEEDSSAKDSFIVRGDYYNVSGVWNWTDEIRINKKTGEVDIQTQNSEGENITYVAFHRAKEGHVRSDIMKY